MTGGTSMDFHDERMLRLMQQLPQNADPEGYNAVIPVVDFEFSQSGDPVKDRRRNLKRAVKALKPVRRWFAVPGFGLIPFVGRAQWKYADGNRCVIDGAECTHLDYGDLFDVYFRDHHTKTVRAFRPWTGVLPGKGNQLQGTYCPQHMQLYHLLMQWIEQESSEGDKGFFKRMRKRGVSFVPVRREPKADSPALLRKWEEAFVEAQRDGIPMMHFRNPVTGENDLTILIFDNRELQLRQEQGTTLMGPPEEETMPTTEG